MKRIIWRVIIAGLLAVHIAIAVVIWRAPDPRYKLAEMAALGRFREFDGEISEVAAAARVDPLLLKAVAWKASRFDPGAVSGTKRGLLLVDESVAVDWAASRRIESFMITDLFDARTNLQAGAWALARAMERWRDRDDPVPYALAEFHAGRAEVEARVEGFLTPAGMIGALRGETRDFVNDTIRRFRGYRPAD